MFAGSWIGAFSRWCVGYYNIYWTLFGGLMDILKDVDKKKYYEGTQNKIIRYYFYSQRGLGLFNEFRYVFMLIFGIYITFKLTNPLWLVGMFAVSLPALILIGYIAVHHVGKVVDFLNVQFSTHWTRYQFELQENILKELKKLNGDKNV